MIVPSKVRFVDDKLKISFERLKNGKDDEKQIHEWLIKAFEQLEQNCFCGIQVQKKLLPKEYSKLGVTNLWKYNLPNAWRLLYTVENQEILVVSIILEWMNHKDYERRFKY